MTSDDLLLNKSENQQWYTQHWRNLNTATHEEIIDAMDIDKIPDLDTYLEITQHIGNIKRAGTNNMFGINHRGLKAPIPENRDQYGLTFFTRPQLNLSGANIRKDRRFYDLLNNYNNNTNIQAFVRQTLDPRLQMDDALSNWKNVKNGESLWDPYSSVYNKVQSSPLVDPRMGFIPILTNNLVSLSGWPDLTLNSYTSEQGLKGNQWIMVDSAYDFLEAYDLSATFRNTRDEPIILMFQTWERYMSLVFEGALAPYLDMIANNEMDYNTRIYRLVLDESRRYVKKIAACGAAFPTTVPTGKFFDYSDEDIYNKSTREIDIQFHAVGAEYNDMVTCREFNWVSAIFNSDVRQYLNSKSTMERGLCSMIEIPRGMLWMLNHRGYPIIDYNTLELKWLIHKNSKDLNTILKYIDKTKLPTKNFEKAEV